MFEIAEMCCVSRNLYNRKTFMNETSAVSYFEDIISNLLEHEPYVEEVGEWILIGFDGIEMLDYVLVFKNAPNNYQRVVKSRVSKIMERYETDSIS